MSKFWDKALKCEHKNLYPDYLEYINCSTPYCSGSEVHCKSCGVFISSCKCMCNNWMDGWSMSRRRAHEQKIEFQRRF